MPLSTFYTGDMLEVNQISWFPLAFSDLFCHGKIHTYSHHSILITLFKCSDISMPFDHFSNYSNHLTCLLAPFSLVWDSIGRTSGGLTGKTVSNFIVEKTHRISSISSRVKVNWIENVQLGWNKTALTNWQSQYSYLSTDIIYTTLFVILCT